MQPSRNQVLLSLPANERAMLASHLCPAELPQGMVLHETGSPVHKVYFPEGGAVSLGVALATGEIIETALIGYDGAVGGQEALRQTAALSRAVVQIAGPALAVEADWLRRCAEGSELGNRLERYDRFILAQAQQSAACNAAHSLDARLARWLLRAHDLCGTCFTLTQEALAECLGVRRTSLSLSAHGFQNAGLVRYRRGVINIVDSVGLRAKACECFTTLAAHRERLQAQAAARLGPTKRAS